MKVLWDGAYGFSSLSEKTRKSNHLQMSEQRQHFLRDANDFIHAKRLARKKRSASRVHTLCLTHQNQHVAKANSVQ